MHKIARSCVTVCIITTMYFFNKRQNKYIIYRALFFSYYAVRLICIKTIHRCIIIVINNVAILCSNGFQR